MSSPMEKLAELEARMALKESGQDATIATLQKEIHDLKEKIAELIVLLEAFKSFGKLAGMLERFAIFVGKMSLWIGGLYALYKFGLAEIAREIRGMKG